MAKGKRKNYYSLKHNVSAYRSGLEETVSEQIEDFGLPVHYEAFKIPYIIPASNHTYCVDFVLPNGILIETKGVFGVKDRQKHLFIKAQHPELDLRFVFSRSASRLYKGSKTTYAKWCEKNGYQYADKLIPEEWLKEPMNQESMSCLKDIDVMKHK